MASICMYWARQAKVLPPEKVVLLNLADDADKYGRVKFSLSGLASDCDLSIAEIKTLLDELTDKKLILLEQNNVPSRNINSWQQALLLINRSSGEVAHVSN